MAANIFSIIEGLTVDKADILEAELFSEQYLSAAFPTYDFRQGTALRDMTVRPNATLLALVNKAIKYYFDDTDIVNMTNDTDSNIVDSKLSNFFITRKSGDKSVVRARLYFSFPTTKPISVVIPSSASFSVDSELLFYPEGNISVNADPGVYAREDNKYYFFYDGSEDLHYVDIDLVAESASEDYDLYEGDILYFTVFSPYFVQGNIQYLISSAVATETNEEMVSRSYSAVSTRNLINTPSIKSKISDNFNYAGEVYPVGLGSPYLYRDILTILQPHTDGPDTIESYHRGGHVDVYVDTSTVVQRLQFALDDSNSFSVSGPVVKIRRSPEPQSGKEEDTIPFEEEFNYDSINVSEYIEGVPTAPLKDLGLSASQVTQVTVPISSPGETITVDITTFSGLNAIHTYINDADNRVVCADYLARAFEPVYINVELTVRESTDGVAIKEAIAEYIESISSGGKIYMSSIVSAIQNSGVEDFIMPIDVTAISMNKHRRYSLSDTGNVDEVSTIVLDTFNIRPTQMFRVGDINITGVTL